MSKTIRDNLLALLDYKWHKPRGAEPEKDWTGRYTEGQKQDWALGQLDQEITLSVSHDSSKATRTSRAPQALWAPR